MCCSYKYVSTAVCVAHLFSSIKYKEIFCCVKYDKSKNLVFNKKKKTIIQTTILYILLQNTFLDKKSYILCGVFDYLTFSLDHVDK